MGLSRRKFVSRFFLGALGLFLLDLFWFEKYFIQWNRFDISNNPSERIKIIQLTDLHLDEIKYFHKSIAKRINKENPDFLVITGDSINNTNKLRVLDSFLGLIDLHIKMVAIMGNREYRGKIKIDDLQQVYEKHNGKLLINSSSFFNVKNRALNIIGIDDLIGGNPNFQKSSKNIDVDIDSIVLNHCPEYSNNISELNEKLNLKIKMILSGHTHGGQITFLGKEFFKPKGSGNYLRGWYSINNLRMYVSKGIGTSVIPFRLGSRAEATIFYI